MLRKLGKFILTIIILVPTLAVLATFGLLLLLRLKEQEWKEYQILAASIDVATPVINIDALNPLEPQENWKTFQVLQSELQKTADLKAEVKRIEDEFTVKYNEFADDFLGAYKPQTALTELVDTLLIPEAEIAFQAKRFPDKYFLEPYLKLRKKVKELNLTNGKKILWQYRPELELASMTMAEKVGQLFIWPAQGTGISSQQKEFIRNFGPGGFILWAIMSKTRINSLSS
jgi:hypothetical protein